MKPLSSKLRSAVSKCPDHVTKLYGQISTSEVFFPPRVSFPGSITDGSL